MEKPLSDYHKNLKLKHGVQVYCKACKSEMQTASAANLNAYHRKYRATPQYQRWLASWHKTNRVRILAQRKSHRDSLRLKALEHYGLKCACCGESTPVFLAIDHIHGGGTKQRKETGRSSSGFHYWLQKHGYPKEFQTLCHNCNWAKHALGKCPHKK